MPNNSKDPSLAIVIQVKWFGYSKKGMRVSTAEDASGAPIGIRLSLGEKTNLASVSLESFRGIEAVKSGTNWVLVPGYMRAVRQIKTL